MKRTIVIQFVVVLCLSVGALIAQEGKISVEKCTSSAKVGPSGPQVKRQFEPMLIGLV